MIFLPVCLVFNMLITNVLFLEQNKSNLGRIMALTEIVLLLYLTALPVFYFFKKMHKKAVSILLIQAMVIIITNVTLSSYGINPEGITFFIHKKEYLRIIKNSPSMAEDGGAKLVKIKLNPVWLACDSYVVYDESDEISNPNGKFRGINYLYINEIAHDKKIKTKADFVNVKKYTEHIYIVHICENTG